MTEAKRRWDRREHGGARFRKGPRCDCCGKPTGDAYLTDDCAGLGDGPGFTLCDKPRCTARYQALDTAERLALFAAAMAARSVDRYGAPKPVGEVH